MYIRQIIEGILGLIICLLPIPEKVDHEELKKVQMHKDRIKFNKKYLDDWKNGKKIKKIKAEKENEFDEEKIKINK